MLNAIIGSLFGIGLFFILADTFKIPYYKSSTAIVSISKKQKEKTSGLNIWLKGIAEWIAKHIRLNEFKRTQLESDLKCAQMEISPEMYKANAIVKALVIGVLAIPVAFIFPLLVPVILIMAVFLYGREVKAVSRRISLKRKRIEYELPRFVFVIEKTLKHSRDVLYMLETYAENAGDEMQSELKITVADMRSGNYESALQRLEVRVGSPLMSDVCRGLISMIRGDDTAVYWAALGIKFNDMQRNMLKAQADKVPRKVRRLSMCLLFCFMLIYIVVILSQIMSSLGVLFN